MNQHPSRILSSWYGFRQHVFCRKTEATATVQPVASSHSSEEQGIRRGPDRDVKNAVWAIVTGVALPCIPILVILAVLFAFIFKHKINPWEGYPQLALNSSSGALHGFDARLSDIRHNGGSAAYLVKYNPSTLTTIASWTSRIIPYLTSSIMALVAFFAARYIVQESKRGEHAVLPDPEQLTILIGLLGGSSVTPLKDTLFYRWLKKERLVSPVPAVFWVLAFITTLGLIIPLVDTWFGIATHATTITTLTNTSAPHGYGRQLDRYGPNANCPDGPRGNISDEWITDSFWPCSVQVAVGASNHLLLTDPLVSTKLQYGLSTTTVVSNYTNGTNNWFFYTDPAINSKLDFMTTSPAISTPCMPMTQKCLGNGSELGGSFECSTGFRGNVYNLWPALLGNMTAPNDTTGSSDMGIAFAGDFDLNAIPQLVNTTTPDGIPGPSWPEILLQNPTYFGTWAMNHPSADVISGSLSNDPEFMDSAAGTLWFLNCSATVVNATYTWSNGSLQTFTTQLVSPEMAALFLGQYSIYVLTADFDNSMRYSLETIANLAALSDSMTQLSQTWATEFSRLTLARAVGAFAPLNNQIEQQRQAGVIVARIPLVPLYLLVSVKLVYVIAVIALAIGAYAFTHPAETEVVKAQLSTKGLAAAHFDQPGLLQQNAVKAVQERLDKVGAKGQSNTESQPTGPDADVEPQPDQLKRAQTSPAEVEGGKPKVGLVPNADGVWKFMVMADGVWHSISPIVKTVVFNEAQQGELGAVGGVINAWKG